MLSRCRAVCRVMWSRYPVLPWVVRDFVAPQLDLSDPAVYRDLSKPIGALNPSRLAKFVARMEVRKRLPMTRPCSQPTGVCQLCWPAARH
jgi:hypothetical protein